MKLYLIKNTDKLWKLLTTIKAEPSLMFLIKLGKTEVARILDLILYGLMTDMLMSLKKRSRLLKLD